MPSKVIPHAISIGIVAITLAAIIHPINYLGLSLILALHIYHKESSRLGAEKKAAIEALNKVQSESLTTKVAQLEDQIKELQKLQSLQKLNGASQWK